MAGNPMTTLQIFHSHPLWHFLEQHPCSGREATITGMGELNGKWHIPDAEYPVFLDLLHDYLYVRKHRPLGFVEQPRLNAAKPLLIDLDFHYNKALALERRFTEENIREFCARVAQAYNHFFDMSVYDTLRFFVTLRPQPYADKDKIKDGIHILCPDAPLSNEKWNVIRKYLLSQNIISEVFGHTSYLNKDEDVFDPSMGRKQGWMFYGASKPSVPAYNLTNVFEYTPDSQYWEDLDVAEFTPKQLLKLMSVRYDVPDDINTIKDDVEQEYYELANPPRYTPEPTNAFQQAAVGLMAASDPTLNALNTLVNIYANPEATNIVRRLVLECLSEDRAENHDSWMRVGWCLHNIAHTDEMFHLWMEFTEIKCPHKWNHHRAREVHQLKRNWDTGMRMDGDGPRLTERSLHKWARDDSPQVYTRVIDEDTAAYIHNTTDATHYHISLLMQKMYGSTYIASVHAKDTDWHHYDEVLNMWRPLNQGMELRQKICVEVANQIQKASLQAAQKNLATNDVAMKEFYAKKQKMLVGMQEKLYNFGFGTSVMNMCSQIFCEPDFEQKLNVDPFLFGCANGVLELRSKYVVEAQGSTATAAETNAFAGIVNQTVPTSANPVFTRTQVTRERVIFRQGRPEDYVSFLAGKNAPETDAINYIPYSEFVKNKDPRLDEIQDFFTKLFPREDLKKHVLKLLASCLEGMNREQLYYFFIGVGSNGKSKLITLMKYVFGDYQTSLQATVFTRKRPESGAANPDIMAIKCRRFIYSQEPDDKEPLNTSRMKQMSGEDMLEARAMYRDQEKFKVMGKMFMMCNRLPPINSMDNGTWRRIRVIPFESRFEETDHPDLIAKKPNMYPRDNNLDEKLLTWREPFLSYLVHLYETEYIPNGLKPEPAVVKQESEKYKADHDAFAKFRCERIRELRDGYTEVTNEKVTLKEIVKAYNRWMMATGSKKMDSKELENRCEEAFGDSRGKREYSHIRVFLDEEDLEEFEKIHDETTGEA
jgi:P4 family phage/plasmid primase-like protien